MKLATYSNSDTVCVLNRGLHNVSCNVRERDDALQLHDVRSLVMCDIHFCALKLDNRTVSCSGYVLGFGSYDNTRVMNPLTPDVDRTGFTADNKPMSDTIGTSFRDYNVQVLFYEREVVTVYKTNVDRIECADPFSTCVSSGGETECFGATDVVFLSNTSSFIGGAVTAMPVTLGVLIAARMCLNGDRSGAGLCAAPVAVFLVALLSVTTTTDVAIKSLFYLQGGLCGYLVALLVLYAATRWCVLLRRERVAVAREEAKDNRDDFEKDLDQDLEDVDQLSIEASALHKASDGDAEQEVELTGTK